MNINTISNVSELAIAVGGIAAFVGIIAAKPAIVAASFITIGVAIVTPLAALAANSARKAIQLQVKGFIVDNGDIVLKDSSFATLN
jgi:hypothetical protein